MRRGYVINKYKGYSIRNHHFVPQANGGLLFETDDPEVQRLIENADGYGAFIHPLETPEEIAQMKLVEEQATMGPTPTLAHQSGDDPGTPDESLNPLPESTSQEVEQPPIAVQGARGTGSSKATRKGQVIGAKK